MKKRILIALVVVLALAATASVVWAGGPAEKATGGVWFNTRFGQVKLVFNAHNTDPAKGKLSWTRYGPSANAWSGHVVDVVVTGDDQMDFTVRVTHGTPPEVVGCDITFWVIDGGEPSVGFDWASVTAVVDSGPGDTCGADGQIQVLGTAIRGNLQVHTY